MIKLNDKNREFLGFTFSYVTYLLILLSIIYYGFFIIRDINWGIIGTIILIITAILFPIFYYKSLRTEKEESEK
jgi:hypothetical protein